MSYDYPEGYEHPPPQPKTLRQRLVDRYWKFILWCALDAKSSRLNDWGMKRIYKEKR